MNERKPRGHLLHPRVSVTQLADRELAAEIAAWETWYIERCELDGRDATWEHLVVVGLSVEARMVARGEEGMPLPGFYDLEAWAADDLERRVLDIVARHGLTSGEIGRMLHLYVMGWLKIIVRVERHGDDPDARADLA